MFIKIPEVPLCPGEFSVCPCFPFCTVILCGGLERLRGRHGCGWEPRLRVTKAALGPESGVFTKAVLPRSSAGLGW